MTSLIPAGELIDSLPVQDVNILARAEGDRQALMIKHAVFLAGATALVNETGSMVSDTATPLSPESITPRLDIHVIRRRMETPPVLVSNPHGIDREYVAGSISTTYRKRKLGRSCLQEWEGMDVYIAEVCSDLFPIQLPAAGISWLHNLDYGRNHDRYYPLSLNHFGRLLYRFAKAADFDLLKYKSASEVPRPNEFPRHVPSLARRRAYVSHVSR